MVIVMVVMVVMVVGVGDRDGDTDGGGDGCLSGGWRGMMVDEMDREGVVGDGLVMVDGDGLMMD